ncbi:MAG TPA: hypothetical protein VJN02_10510 [Gammaproteobacteria bacterium]|nr:hypothetical protein [Gammaproteobacteria bacterium]
MDEYEKICGHEKLLELMEECPWIRNPKKEVEEFNKLVFVVWLLNKELAAEMAVQQEIAFTLLCESLDEEMKKAFDKEKWEKNWQIYLQILTEQMWERLKAIAQETLKKKYEEDISFWRGEIQSNITYLVGIREAKIEKMKVLEEVVIQNRQDRSANIIAICNELPSLHEYEWLREKMIADAKRYGHDLDFLPEKYCKDISNDKEKLVEVLHHYKYSSTIVSQCETKCSTGEKDVRYDAVVEKSYREVKQEVAQIDADINKYERMDKALASEQAKPTYDCKKLATLVKEERELTIKIVIEKEKQNEQNKPVTEKIKDSDILEKQIKEEEKKHPAREKAAKQSYTLFAKKVDSKKEERNHRASQVDSKKGGKRNIDGTGPPSLSR